MRPSRGARQVIAGAVPESMRVLGDYQGIQERTAGQPWTTMGAAVTAVRTVVTIVKAVMTRVRRIIVVVCRSVAL
jgi:hypothetical protein